MVQAINLAAFPLEPISFPSLEAFAAAADQFDPTATILEILEDEDWMPVVDLDLTNALRALMGEFV